MAAAKEKTFLPHGAPAKVILSREPSGGVGGGDGADPHSSGHNVAVSLDARGLKCPWPVLRLARAMRSADSVHVRADDPSAPAEIAALAAAQGWIIRTDGDGWLISRPAR